LIEPKERPQDESHGKCHKLTQHLRLDHMPVLNPQSFIDMKVLVGIPQRSKFGDSGAKFGPSWECDVAKLATFLNKEIFQCHIGLKFI
jgi:hypothetical protein